MFKAKWTTMCVVAFCIVFSCTVRNIQGDEISSGSVNQYWCDARLFSLNETDGLGSFQNYTAGGAEPTDILTLGAANATRKFSVTVLPAKLNGRFTANVSVVPDESDELTAEKSYDVDLSNLKPRSIDVAKDGDGRVYRLTLVPRIVQRVEPKRFRSADLLLNKWHFQHSPVILNDQDYLGILNMGSAEVAWVDVPGLARIEFSLLPLTGAEPEGILNDGTIRISHNSETTLRITNVRNGITSSSLPGGPYQVWVRWNKPTQSIDQYRDSLKLRIRELRDRSERGDIVIATQTIERLEETAKSGRVVQIQSGLRKPKDDELIDDSSVGP